MNVHLVSLGYPKNQVDGELMLGLLARDGVAPVAEAEAADCVVVNTCAFIDRAKQESIETILELAAWKGRAPGRRLVVAGCLPSATGPSSSRRCPRSMRSWAPGSCRGSWTWSAGWTRAPRGWRLPRPDTCTARMRRACALAASPTPT